MTCVRTGRTARPVHLLILAALLAAPVAAAAATQPGLAPPPIVAAIRHEANGELESFYRARDFQPLWLEGRGLGPGASALLDVIETSDLDGLKPRQFRPDRLQSAVERAASGDPEDLARAEILLSKAYVALVQAMRQPRLQDMQYSSEVLAPVVPTTEAALDSAAAAPSMETFVHELGWMHPLYGQLRNALAQTDLTDEQRQLLKLNLERARAVPAYPADRYVLVDAAAARLYMYEHGEVRGTMKVVVGKPDNQTPMMAGFIRTAILNPYWNIPPDLVKLNIAPNVVQHGVGYLKAKGYEVLSDWSDDATIVDPSTVDWKAVAAGETELRVRQLPGRDNFMGKMKFMFPNDRGIYLHDTPEKQLMLEPSRQYSSGCVRLEDAARLGRWLFGKPLLSESRAPEQQIALPAPVPVYITYLTAAPEDGKIAFRPDVYKRDGTELAQLEADVRGTR